MAGRSIHRLEHTILQWDPNYMPDLGLQTQAKQHFAFLVAENGYRCTLSTEDRVRFESKTTFIELVYDEGRSFELGLMVGKAGFMASKNPSFSIGEILRLRHAPEAKKFSLIQVTSREVLASFVEMLAQVLRAYGEDFITGNQQSFAELAELRRRETDAYALRKNLRRAWAAADIAWHKKDYSAVVNTLSPFRAALTAAEVGKLEFSEKQLRLENHD
jgi:hypothetical protein